MKIFLLLLLTINISFGQNLFNKDFIRSLDDNNIKTKNVKIFQDENSLGGGEQKSVSLAVLYSLLLPGMGEMYVGNYSSGKYFSIAEGLLWITLFGFDRYGTLVQNDARDFAAQHAKVTLTGKNDRYFVDIGDYQNIWEYNEEMLRNRQPYKMYNEQTALWDWDSKSNRVYYRNLRISSDQAFNNVSFVAAAIGINHLVSAINAALRAKDYNKNIQQSNLIDIHANILGGFIHTHGIMISVSKTF